MILNSDQLNALKEFCALILCGHQELAFYRCKAHMECDRVEYGGIPDVLYLLSGMDSDPDDPWGNMASEEHQCVTLQSYLVSSDAGTPELEDFFWYIENIKAARGLNFSIQKEKFLPTDGLVEWLKELSQQITELSIVHFDGGGDDYHFTILNKEESDKAMGLFQRLTAHIHTYPYTSCVITNSFCG